MLKDPIVEQVRAARERLAADCGFDIRKIIARAQKAQIAARHVVSFEQPTSAKRPARNNENGPKPRS